MLRTQLILLLSFPAISLSFSNASAADPAPIRSLSDAYHRALQTNERITISREAVRAAEALYRETLGSSLPELSFRHESTWRDTSVSGSTAAASRIIGTESDGMFRVSVSNLSGYRELAALRAGRSEISQRAREVERAEQLLLADVASAFYSVLQARENAATTERLVNLADRRLKELRDRVRVGRTRDADAIQQEFQVVELRSQAEELARLVGARLDLLAFLVGQAAVDPQANEAPDLAPREPLEFFVSRVETRPDVRAAADAVEVSRGFANVARSDFLPRVTAAGNYYVYRRPESREGQDWDASLVAQLPIFSWGASRAALSSANAVVRQREAEYQATRRFAELEVRSAYRDVLSAAKQMDYQSRALGLARRDYELQRRDDRRGLVTSLEVLESLNRLNTAELALNNARLVARLAGLNLEITSGAKPEEILK